MLTTLSLCVIVATVVLFTLYFCFDTKNYFSLINVFPVYTALVGVRLMHGFIYPESLVYVPHSPMWVLIVCMLASTTATISSRRLIGHSRSTQSDYETVGGFVVHTPIKVALGLSCILIGILSWIQSIRFTGYSLLEFAAIAGSSDRYLPDTPLIYDLGMQLGLAGVIILSLCASTFRAMLLVYLASVPLLVISLILARRSLVIPIVLVPALIYFIRVRTPSFRLVLCVGLVGFALSSSLMAMRYYYGYGYKNGPSPITKSYLTGALSHSAEADPLIYAIDNYNAFDGEAWIFKSFYAWTYEVLPRVLVREKPTRLVVGNEFARTFWGSTNPRHGTPATIIGTLYVGGGIFLVLAGAVLLGVAYTKVDQLKSYAARDDLGAVIYVSLFLFSSVFLFRLGDLSAAIGQALVTFTPAVLVMSIGYAVSFLSVSGYRAARSERS